VYLDEMAQTIAGILIADYGGLPKKDGWIAAYACRHQHDYPGKHFYFIRSFAWATVLADMAIYCSGLGISNEA